MIQTFNESQILNNITNAAVGTLAPMPVAHATPAPAKKHIWGMRLEDIQAALMELGILENKARYHSKQIFRWIYQRKVFDFALMTDLSKEVRKAMLENFECRPPMERVLEKVSVDGTRKYLFKLFDGHTIEAVLIPSFKGEQDVETDTGEITELRRLTICISSQVGCAMGCKFCLTATMGFIRNLKVEEIVGQVLELSRNADITNIVFMGMGEPLHNIENVARSIEILLRQDGLNFSKRKITVSTSGLIPAIRKFNERMSLENRVNLAISLNGSNNENRGLVMPVNKAYPIEDLMDALKDYQLEPHRRITFEYVMMKGINDSDEDAAQVVKLMRKLPSKVNIIPFNPHHGSQFDRPSDARVVGFHTYLNRHDVAATIRHSRGRDILAACGQLKSAEDAKQKNLN